MSSNALDYITIRGFKSIAFVDKLEVKPINIVIGSNGAGKSNFIGVFAFLHAIRNGRLRNYVVENGGAERVLHFGSKRTEAVYFHLSFASFVGDANQYELKLRPTNDHGLYVASEAAFSRPEDAQHYVFPFPPVEQGREAAISDPSLQGAPDWIRRCLESWRIYHRRDTRSSSSMRKTARLNDNEFFALQRVQSRGVPLLSTRRA